MRTIAHHHFDRTLNHDLFFFCFTDEHARKILVDKDRSITCMPDLKYGALLPADFMMQTLSWLINQTVGVIDTASTISVEQSLMIYFEKVKRSSELTQLSVEYELRMILIMIIS